jgi:hypothetical protein
MGPYREQIHVARNFLDEMEDQNYVRTGRRGDAQDHLKAVDVRVANFAKLNVPERVQDELVRTYFTITNITESEYDHQSFRFPQTPNSNNDSKVGDAMTTMDAERFCPLMETVWPVPYLAQYYLMRSRAILENTKLHITDAFSHTFGTKHKDNHYMASGAKAYKTPKPRNRASRKPEEADGLLCFSKTFNIF